MLAGCSMVFGLVVLMNAEEQKRPEAEAREAQIVVDQPKRTPPKKKERRPPPRRTDQRSQAKAAPRPSLASSISGVSFGLSTYSGLDVGTAAKSVLDDGTAEDAVMTANTVDVPPRPISQAPPGYPPRARARNIEGYVKLSLLVGDDGGVEKVKVLEAEPAGVFEDDTIAAARTWRFQPAQYRGQSKRVWITIRVPFKLS
jgi:protein TonB